MWSLFTLRTAHTSPKKVKESRQAKPKRQQSQTRVPKLDSKTELKRRLNNNVTRGLNASASVAASIPVATPTPSSVEAKVTRTHKPITTPSENIKPQKPLMPISFEEKLEPLLLDEPVFDEPALVPSPPSTPKFTLINADDEPIEIVNAKPVPRSKKTGLEEPEQIPLFNDVATATFKPKATVTKTQTPPVESSTYEDDAFDRFIKSKNDDLDF